MGYSSEGKISFPTKVHGAGYAAHLAVTTSQGRNEMTEGQEHEWHIELDDMRARLRWALNNLDEIPKRTHVRHNLETVLSRLTELCELTKGERK